jgi:hypothetical protein
MYKRQVGPLPMPSVYNVTDGMYQTPLQPMDPKYGGSHGGCALCMSGGCASCGGGNFLTQVGKFASNVGKTLAPSIPGEYGQRIGAISNLVSNIPVIKGGRCGTLKNQLAPQKSAWVQFLKRWAADPAHPGGYSCAVGNPEARAAYYAEVHPGKPVPPPKRRAASSRPPKVQVPQQVYGESKREPAPVPEEVFNVAPVPIFEAAPGQTTTGRLSLKNAIKSQERSTRPRPGKYIVEEQRKLTRAQKYAQARNRPTRRAAAARAPPPTLLTSLPAAAPPTAPVIVQAPAFVPGRRRASALGESGRATKKSRGSVSTALVNT